MQNEGSNTTITWEDYFDAIDRSANHRKKNRVAFWTKKDDDVEIGYISVQFEGDFEGLAEILGLERSDGLDIRRCYLDYLEPLVSNYKAARSSNPTGGYEDEGIVLQDYHGEVNKVGSTAAKENDRVAHSGITLKKGRGGKCDATSTSG
ncbi:hypothetical protein Tco_0828966 [Tanacetum coccineum]